VGQAVDLVWFHATELPARLVAGNGALAAEDAARLGPISFVTAAGSWTYIPADGTVSVVDGTSDNARVVVEIDDQSFADLTADLDTPTAMLYQQRATVSRGNPLRFIRWEPALRAMFHGRPIYDASAIDLRDRDGGPLDPCRTFDIATVMADPDAVAHQLSTTGFVVVRGVFGADEVADLLHEADQLRALAEPGDGASWWGRNANGDALVTRVLNGSTRPTLRALYDNERVKAVVDATGLELRGTYLNDTDGVTVLWKIPNMVEGLADLPWHRDCGMGGHAATCPTLVMTICLTEGTPEAGELRALPGSHTMSHPFIDGNAAGAPTGVSIAVTAGDISIHDGDVMHVSLPPTADQGPHRVSILLSFARTDAVHHRGERHYNDALLTRADGQVEHLGHRLGG
jgi:ectoine hydroxylase-related dioxygenase (phytanoyl-CoA dioxygenase family)